MTSSYHTVHRIKCSFETYGLYFMQQMHCNVQSRNFGRQSHDYFLNSFQKFTKPTLFSESGSNANNLGDSTNDFQWAFVVMGIAGVLVIVVLVAFVLLPKVRKSRSAKESTPVEFGYENKGAQIDM